MLGDQGAERCGGSAEHPVCVEREEIELEGRGGQKLGKESFSLLALCVGGLQEEAGSLTRPAGSELDQVMKEPVTAVGAQGGRAVEKQLAAPGGVLRFPFKRPGDVVEQHFPSPSRVEMCRPSSLEIDDVAFHSALDDSSKLPFLAKYYRAEVAKIDIGKMGTPFPAHLFQLHFSFDRILFGFSLSFNGLRVVL